MLIDSWHLAEAVVRRVAASKSVVVDVETSGLDWRNNHIVGWSLATGPTSQDCFYVPLRHAGGGNIPHDIQIPTTPEGWDGSIHPFETILLPALEGKFLIFHNAAFDLRFMHRIGWRPTGHIGDTLIAAYLTDELRPSLSLDACCKTEGVAEKKGEELYKVIATKFGCAADKSSMGSYWKMDGSDHHVWDYASGDGTSTWQLWQALNIRIAKPYYTSQSREYTLSKIAKVEMDLISVLHKMSVRGIRVDEERLDFITKWAKNSYDVGMAELEGMNVKSPIAVKAYLEANGVTDWPLTEKGAPSFPEAWLRTHKPGQVIVAVRKSKTLLDSFLTPLRQKHLHNGRVYPEIHQTRGEEFGTVTGRMSSSNPNFQAIPGKRQADLGRMFRSIFIPDEGMEFCEADYSTCEIRICAHYCQAKLWVDGFNAGVDAHTSISTALGIKRQHAKTINLALMTGAGKRAIAEDLGLSLEEGSAIVDTYFGGLPELKQFQISATNAFKNRGFVSTLLGRRLQLNDPRFAYKAINRLTQGGNGDMTKERLVAMDKCDITPVMPVHDSILFQNKKGDTKSMMDALNTMCDMSNLGLTVPMEVEYGTGMNWGEASFTVDGKVRWQP